MYGVARRPAGARRGDLLIKLKKVFMFNLLEQLAIGFTVASAFYVVPYLIYEIGRLHKLFD